MGKTIRQRVKNILEDLDVKETIDKDEIALEIWGDDNYFVRRSLDVHICNVKKELLEDGKEYETSKHNEVKRIK